ncbi:DUF6279 family lipoprotein [Shewanella acanthi]|uniref:DUF6279 family lipoprotein n=1 Tax=Shewanella acanthi TaxID=2864212 RepID=UPI001C654B32|nr:DUF6279 family lipoprotein [Shewanella acanthi]QYJ80623.1 hypothetical protein K0H61_10535 [Shewanella acanthi]
MKKYLTLLVLVLGLTACSTKLSYHFLDWVIGWQLDDYVSLNRSQQKSFDTLVDKFILWHQAEELKGYVSQLTELEGHIKQKTLTPELWLAQVKLAEQQWYRIFEFILPDLQPIISSLTDPQVKQILKQLGEDEQELSKDFAGKSSEQLQQDADERLGDFFDEWLGSVTSEQQALIHQYNQQRLSTLDMWLDYRHEWLRQFDIALSQRTYHSVLRERLTLLMTRPNSLKSDKHKQLIEQNTVAFGAMLININASLTPKQSKHFYRKLDKLIQDLKDLNQEGIENLAKE